MEIWKECGSCEHETPQERIYFKMFPRPVEGFIKDSETALATSIWIVSIDAYQFTECKKCEAPILHIDTYKLKNNKEGLCCINIQKLSFPQSIQI